MRSRFVTRLAAAALVVLPALAVAAPQGGPGAAAGGRTELTWYGHSAFVLKTPAGTVLALDPWFKNPKSPDPDAGSKLEKVDYLLVSHGHSDHVGESVAIAQRTGAKLVGSSDLGKALVRMGFPEKQAGFQTTGNAGGAIDAGDATIILVPAIHSSDVNDANVHLGGGAPLGFVVKIANGPTLYFTGDTDVTADLKLIPERYGRIDYMLACIGGHFTMDPAGAALAASWVKPRTVIPMHYGTFPLLTGTPKALEAALHGRAKVVVMEPGKAMGL